MRKAGKEMELKRDTETPCSRCGYELVPVFASEKGRRRIIALTCPEPYCDHMQMVTREEARVIERNRASNRDAN